MIVMDFMVLLILIIFGSIRNELIGYDISSPPGHHVPRCRDVQDITTLAGFGGSSPDLADLRRIWRIFAVRGYTEIFNCAHSKRPFSLSRHTLTGEIRGRGGRRVAVFVRPSLPRCRLDVLGNSSYS